MPDRTDLAARLIRNVHAAELGHAALEPKYECRHARPTVGMAAKNEEPEICEYPDSDRFMAEAGVNGDRPFGVIGRMSEQVGYWEGEK